MSQIGKEFLRDWIGANLDADATAAENMKAMLADAEEQGITQQEIADACSGNILKAMTKAMTAANKA